MYKSYLLVVLALGISLISFTIVECRFVPDLQPMHECGRNAESVQCRSTCPVSCEHVRHPSKRTLLCPLICTSGCDCKKGYVFREGESGDCVPEAECLEPAASTTETVSDQQHHSPQQPDLELSDDGVQITAIQN